VVDFTGSASQQRGPINATLAVTQSAVYYALICLLDADQPLNQGVFNSVDVHAPEGTLVNARPPAAVAAGNVETSQRIVDVLFGALAQAFPDRMPAASQGTMNNLTLGGIHPELGSPWAYYETLGGGAGGTPEAPGASGLHTHMSNTRNTPAEALEYHYPIRVRRYQLRNGSSGAGAHAGGEGVVRELEMLAPVTATVLSDRRERPPYGLAGGETGECGENWVNEGGEWLPILAKASLDLPAGSRIRIRTPGGGGWGVGS